MSWLRENGVILLLLTASLARSKGGMIGIPLAGLCHILSAVMCPAYIFWKAYANYSPDSFLWWCRIAFGLLILVMFAIGLANSLEKAGNAQTDLKHHIKV